MKLLAKVFIKLRIEWLHNVLFTSTVKFDFSTTFGCPFEEQQSQKGKGRERKETHLKTWIPCYNYAHTYISETGRTFGTRLEEYT